MLNGLLLRSGNDSAVALAEHTAGSIENFAEMMNKKAEMLQLKNTHFVTPHGLDDPNHYTTPVELAKITDYALKNKKFIEIVGKKSAQIIINESTKTIENTNEILCSNVEGVYGVKTGFTSNAGRCLVTSVKRKNMDLIIVVLMADTKNDRTKDTLKLIDYAYSEFRMENIEEKVREEFESWKNINEDRIYIDRAREKIDTILRRNKNKANSNKQKYKHRNIYNQLLRSTSRKRKKNRHNNSKKWRRCNRDYRYYSIKRSKKEKRIRLFINICQMHSIMI